MGIKNKQQTSKAPHSMPRANQPGCEVKLHMAFKQIQLLHVSLSPEIK